MWMRGQLLSEISSGNARTGCVDIYPFFGPYPRERVSHESGFAGWSGVGLICERRVCVCFGSGLRKRCSNHFGSVRVSVYRFLPRARGCLYARPIFF